MVMRIDYPAVSVSVMKLYRILMLASRWLS
jgi:hypothetical protein